MYRRKFALFKVDWLSSSFQCQSRRVWRGNLGNMVEVFLLCLLQNSRIGYLWVVTERNTGIVGSSLCCHQLFWAGSHLTKLQGAAFHFSPFSKKIKKAAVHPQLGQVPSCSHDQCTQHTKAFSTAPSSHFFQNKIWRHLAEFREAAFKNILEYFFWERLWEHKGIQPSPK